MTENKMPSFINIDSCFISFVPDLVWLFSYVILKSSQDFNIERLVDSTDLRTLDTQPSHQAALVKGEGVDAAMHGKVVKLRAIPLSTSTTLGPVPISHPWVLFIQST